MLYYKTSKLTRGGSSDPTDKKRFGLRLKPSLIRLTHVGTSKHQPHTFDNDSLSAESASTSTSTEEGQLKKESLILRGWRTFIVSGCSFIGSM